MNVSDTNRLLATAVTVTATVMLTLFGAVAVSVVDPVVTPVTVADPAPVLLTVATAALPVAHVNTTFGIATWDASNACAVTAPLPLTLTLTGFGVTVTCVTTGGGGGGAPPLMSVKLS